MARRHTLIWTATATTATLWGVTITMAATNLGTDRLHETVLAGASLAVLVTAALIGLVALRAFTQRAINNAVDAVNGGVDELHQAVQEMRTQVLHFDRGFVTAARAMMAGLLDSSTRPTGGRVHDNDKGGERAA